MKSLKSFSSSYFGAQGRFWQHIKPLIRQDTPRYFDYTMGGFSNPLKAFDELGKEIIVNDMCQYVVLGAKSLLEYPLDTNLNLLHSQILNIKRHHGILSQLGDARISKGIEEGKNICLYAPFTTEQREFIDGVCLEFQNNPRMLFAVGKVLINFTFRGVSWCNKTAQNKKSSEYTIKELTDTIYHWYVKLNEFRDLVIMKGLNLSHRVLSCDAQKLSQEYPALHENATLYADPAWPWKVKYDLPNPYFFVARDLSSILLQKQQDIGQLRWDTMTNDEIADEASTWVLNALNAGGKRFILNTQSTNRPEVSLLEQYIQQKNINVVNKIVQTFSGTHNSFDETWLVCEK